MVVREKNSLCYRPHAFGCPVEKGADVGYIEGNGGIIEPENRVLYSEQITDDNEIVGVVYSKRVINFSLENFVK